MSARNRHPILSRGAGDSANDANLAPKKRKDETFWFFLFGTKRTYSTNYTGRDYAKSHVQDTLLIYSGGNFVPRGYDKCAAY